MSYLVWEATPPKLKSTILVTAFQGWFDVGGSATGALEWLCERSESLKIAHIDPEEFFNFSEERPTTRLVDNRREITWPSNEVHVLSSDKLRHDVVLVMGAEPQLRWRSYANTLVELADLCGTVLLITLGAQIDRVPHTRPVKVTGSTSDPELADRLGLIQPSYEGPTGVVGVLHDRFGEIKTSAVSLRASVPHYVSGVPNPKACRALLERLERITGIATGWAELDEAAQEWEDRVTAAMDGSPEVERYVRHLETKLDDKAAQDVPSADDLAYEFERLLRQQDTDT